MKTLHRHNGSILIEALISLVVLALGIIAIAKLQGTYIKGGAEAEARNVALQLAQQRIDDLRAYNTIEPKVNWPASLPISPYSEIQDNMGGSIAWTTTQVGNTAYNIGWTVENYKVPDDEMLPLELLADNNTVGSSYKKVTVTANWTPPCNKTVTDPCPSENVNLTTYITKLDQYGQTLMGGGGYSTDGPKVQYNPGMAPDVIAIDTTGESIETTLPEPAIKKIASENYFYSQFETVTYTGGDALRNEEFLNINCECEYDNPPIGLGFPAARSIWHPKHDGTPADKALHDEYVNNYFHPDVNDHAFISQTESGRADFLGKQITKVIGQPSAGNSAQHPFCNICCRDHHDAKASHITTNNDDDTSLAGAYACKPDTDFASVGSTNGDRSRCFDPWRPAADYDSSTGDHKHYTGTGVTVAPGGSGVYLESCRLKRINGNFSVFQDWHLHGSTFVAAPRKVFNPGQTGNVVSAYQAYIKDYVSAVIENADNQPVTTINNPATAFVWPEDSATYPVTTSFISRGIYMDYLDSFTLEQLNEVRDSTDPDIAAKFFENAPFNEINLTRLTDWQPQCVKESNPRKGSVNNTASGFVSDGPDADTDPDPGSCVTNYGINLASNASAINRGMVIAINNSPFALSATMLLSNSGIVGTNTPLVENLPAVLYPTANDKSYDTASVRTSTTNLGSCTVIITGAIFKGVGGIAVNQNEVKIFSSPGGECSKSGDNASSGTYTCPVGPQPNGQGLFISGDFVTGDETETVNCSSAVNGIVTITGPSFTTIDTLDTL